MKNHSSSFFKKGVKFLKWIGMGIILVILFFLSITLIVRGINKGNSKITTTNGIQESSYINIGGIEQFIQIRGEDTNNPLILFLHGGPGSPHAYVSYYYQKDLEDDYTIVNWDQPGSGRTYYANPDFDSKTDLSVENIMEDLNELVDYLRNRFGQEKIVIMGHSWGSILGSLYTRDHPEKVSAYIGVGQTISILKGESLAVEKAKEFAIEDGNEEYIEKLTAVFNEFSKTKDYEDLDFKGFMNQRNLTSQYLSCDNLASTLQTFWLGASSPDMSIRDMKWFMKPNLNFDEFLKIGEPLFDYCFYGFNIHEEVMEYKVPAYFISGDCDWITPYILVEEYYQSIKAPHKEMILIPGAGHSPFMDNPKAFSDAVKSVLD